MGCLAIEIFVVPGLSVFGISGGLLLLASLVLASQTFGNLETGRDVKIATDTLATLCVAVTAVIGTAMLLSRFLPAIPVFNQMVLAPPGGSLHDPSEPRLRPDLTSSAGGHLLVGQFGTATTVLRPAGKAEIDGRLVDVVSDGPFVNEGARVEVVRVSGNKIVVRQS
jgi:membrane-bound serine protease (ClpP class)